MPATVKLMDTRGGGHQSRLESAALLLQAAGAPVQRGAVPVGGGGGTAYAAAATDHRGGAAGRVLRDGCGGHQRHGGSTQTDVGWNPRASMAFDSAKGLLNPVGENNCFLNSAVQVAYYAPP